MSDKGGKPLLLALNPIKKTTPEKAVNKTCLYSLTAFESLCKDMTIGFAKALYLSAEHLTTFADRLVEGVDV
jgi:hypothetical protein